MLTLNAIQYLSRMQFNGFTSQSGFQELTVFPLSVVDRVLRSPYTFPHTDISRHIVG